MARDKYFNWFKIFYKKFIALGCLVTATIRVDTKPLVDIIKVPKVNYLLLNSKGFKTKDIMDINNYCFIIIIIKIIITFIIMSYLN